MVFCKVKLIGTFGYGRRIASVIVGNRLKPLPIDVGCISQIPPWVNVEFRTATDWVSDLP